MTSFVDGLAAVRKARQARDDTRDRLYALELRRLELERAVQREKRGQRVVDPAFPRAHARLQAMGARLSAQLETTGARLQELAALPDRINQMRARADEAQKRVAALSSEAIVLGQQLATRPPPAKRAQRPDTALDRVIVALRKVQSQRAAAASHAQQMRTELMALVRDAAAAEEKAAALREERRALSSRLDEIRGEVAALEARAKDTNVDEVVAGNRREITDVRREVDKLENGLRATIADLFGQRTPDEVIGEWDDALPILLLPLRLETRWKTGGDAAELWVRVYPDDVAVTTHEKVLTDVEVEHGRSYWTTRHAAETEEGRTAIWRALATRLSGNRAAWVARQTKPSNWEVALADPAVALTFPQPGITKPDSWTTAPHTRVLPDRFVLLGWRGNELKLNEVGNPVDDLVVLGPSPVDGHDGDERISRSELDQTLTLGESFRWVRDFADAEKRGMAFRVNVDAEGAANGFDELLVLGIKASADETYTKTLIEELFDNHHYSRTGLGLVQQGTPTNNTAELGSGYTRAGRSSDESAAEVGAPLFTPVQDRAVATDGQRLGDFLGIAYDSLLHADGANLTDHAEAVAMNRALYSGTLGYYLDRMLNEVIDEGARGAIRRHFTQLVTGRGPVAAIRVGAQPYGILPTSSFPRWKATRGVEGRILSAEGFEDALHAVLVKLDGAWSGALPRLKTIGDGGGGAENLLDVLGLHPTSEEFYQRVGYSYDMLRNVESLVWTGHELHDVLNLFLESVLGRTFLQQLGYSNVRPDGTTKPLPLLFQLIWRHYHTQIDARELIDGQPLSESEGIKPYDAQTTKNYIDWLLANAADAEALQSQNFGQGRRPSFLLYMLLHFSMAMEAGRGIHRLLARHEIKADELIRSRKFLNVGPQPSPSMWEVFRASANRVIGPQASNRSLLEVLHSPQSASDAGEGVAEQRAAMQVLRSMTTARLERALVEHMDVLSYRLDAWQTSLFTRRLHRQRGLDARPEDRRTGLLLGAYGYLRNARPALAVRRSVSEDTLPPELRQETQNLFEQVDNGGFVHAPSLNHATAAALLRNAYLTHATPEKPDAFAVNLSSDRVRRARDLVDGVRNGQSLETLLGIQFERGLHDWTTSQPVPVILDHLKPVFRAQFPIRRTRIPQAEAVLNGASASTISEDHSVVNGLTLALAGVFPWGVTELATTLSDDQKAALIGEKNGIANTLDALRDVLTAEAAYQLSLGNFDRAAAVVQSVGDGTIPADLEAIRTPRGTTIAFTNRLVVQLSPTENRNPWPAVAVTHRARLEPALNHWLGSLIRDPAQIKCSVVAFNPDDRSEIAAGTISLADLDVQPIDFVYMVRSQPQESSVAELETRVRYAFATANGVGDDAIVRMSFADAGGGAARPFGEVLPLADRMRRLIGSSRPLNARHFQSASHDTPEPPDNVGRLDVAELRTRVGNRIEAARRLFRNAEVAPAVPPLQSAVADAIAAGVGATVTALRAALKRIADAGFAYAFPVSATGTATEQCDALVGQAESLLKRFDELIAETDTRLAAIDAGSEPAGRKVELLDKIVKQWMGGDFVLIPTFTFADSAAVADAHAARDALTAHAVTSGAVRPVDEWLHGVACVRASVHDFEIVRIMAEAATREALPLAPIQLPFRQGDSWLAVEFPETMEVVHDTASIVQHLPQGFHAPGAQSGLLIDEWSETVPERRSVTGLAFNYNAPNSAPPQALLLAVTPQETGRWSWDDLVDTVRDTFRRAQLRAVEPDYIGDMPAIGTLLPALVAEFSTGRGSVSLDYALTIPAIREAVMATTLYSATEPGTE